jgi:sterol desaturase/sphingolipid hydroxylase (fatty acid hydroxylase superfamily)
LVGRTALKYAAWPIIVFGTVALAWCLQNAGAPDPLIVFGFTLALTLPIAALQRWIPYEAAWRGTPGDWSLDFAHLILSVALPASLVRVVAFAAIVGLSKMIQELVGFSLFPSHAPIAVQLGLAVLAGDLGSYWTHRACHTIPVLWRVHALHHSVERMYVLASSRTHPLNAALTAFAIGLPLALLGVDARILALHAVFNTAVGFLQHANVDLYTRPFAWVFSTPDLHRWHHSTDMAESHHNYGTDTAIWDLLFGTRMLPADRQPRTVGVPELLIPGNYWQHLAVPFRLHRYARTRTPPTEVSGSSP